MGRVSPVGGNGWKASRGRGAGGKGAVLDRSQELLGPFRFSRYETRRPQPSSNPPSRRAKRRNFMSTSDQRLSLLERLAEGPVICAEGYLFELERRGYLQAGAFVPEVVLEHPELVAQLHREFVHAGSDVVEAFTYYAHRERLRLIGKEVALEQINRQALAIAKEAARETGALFAGAICNTNVFVGDDA